MINNNQKGVSVYITIIILSILLAVSLGLSSIIVGGAKLSENLSYSIKALHAADTGVERALYNVFKNGNCTTPVTGTCGTDCSYSVEITDPAGTCSGQGTNIKSLGTYKETKRKIEATIGVVPVVCLDDCSEEWGGSCVAKAAGDYDLPACQTCDGVSLTHVNIALRSEDNGTPNTCNSGNVCTGTGSCAGPVCITGNQGPWSCSTECANAGHGSCIASYNGPDCGYGAGSCGINNQTCRCYY
ncbi:hypothetical protein M0Q50_01625 [bacterium]|jgi:hypothetical protein|nr:hypothetical protein [bacterium]